MATRRKKVVVFLSVLAVLAAIGLSAPSVGKWASENPTYIDGWSVTFYAWDSTLGRHEFVKKPKLIFDKNKCVTMPTKEEYCSAIIAIRKTKIIRRP